MGESEIKKLIDDTVRTSGYEWPVGSQDESEQSACICDQYAGVTGSAEWNCPVHKHCSTGSFTGALRESAVERYSTMVLSDKWQPPIPYYQLNEPSATAEDKPARETPDA